MTSAAPQTTQAIVKADVINFGIGQPGFDILPTKILRQAAEHRLTQPDAASYLNYGYEQGDGFLRELLAEFLTAEYGMPVSAETLLITSGASHAIDIVCNYFTQPGDVIFVEEPTFFLILNLFRDYGLTVVPIPVNKNGIDMDVLEEKLGEFRPKFLYTIPTFQNPTGVSVSAENRERIVALSQRHDFLIVADEVYQLLKYSVRSPERQPPPSFATHLDSNQVFSIGSFSKILGPGLRIGWIQTSTKRMPQLVEKGLLASGGGNNHFTSGIVRSVLENGWQVEYLNHLRQLYTQRINCLDKVLRQQLPQSVTWQKPDGGYFFWLQLPENSDGSKLLKVAAEHNVSFQLGSKFSSSDNFSNYMRLCFAFYDEATLQQGVSRLADAISDFGLGSH